MIAETTDLLWPYSFEWVTIDRWTSENVEVEEAFERVAMPELRLEISRDGTVFEEVIPDYGLISSDKGSKGTHRSVRLMFPKKMFGRYFRITYRQGDWTYKLRASLTSSEILAQEKAKFVELLPIESSSKPIRASVLGDSNSVMRYGWVKGLPMGGIEVVENVSLGSSSNAIHATQIPNLSRTDIDVLFIQTTVNEYSPIRDRIYDVDLSRQMIRHVQSWSSQHGITPIYVIQPHRRGLDDVAAGRTPFDQEQYCIEVCEDLGILYINGFSMLRELSALWGRPEESMYADPAHLTHPHAQALGASIAKRTCELMSGSVGLELDSEDVGHKSHDFRIIDLEQVNSSPNVARRRITNSLIDQEMLYVTGDDEISVPVPDGWEVVAFTMNARSCNASIRFTGQTELIRRADFAGYQGLEGYPFVCVRSLMHPVRPRNGVVLISAVAPSEAHEVDEICNKTIPTLSHQDLCLEISQIVIREIERTRSYARSGRKILDLSRDISMKAFTTN